MHYKRSCLHKNNQNETLNSPKLVDTKIKSVKILLIGVIVILVLASDVAGLKSILFETVFLYEPNSVQYQQPAHIIEQTKLNKQLRYYQHLTVQYHQAHLNTLLAPTIPPQNTINSHPFQQNSTKKLSNRHLQQQPSSSSITDIPIVRIIIIVIVVLFVAVPFIGLIIFTIVMLYKRYHPPQNAEEIQLPTPIQQRVNLDQYKLDQIGPYLSNPNQNCSICLDKLTNIRTYCGHFYHGSCLKVWYDKKTTEGRAPTCAVCVSAQINPVKIYCIKCFISGKLQAIYCETPSQKIEELSAYKCAQCRQSTLEQQSYQQEREQDLKSSYDKIRADNNYGDGQRRKRHNGEDNNNDKKNSDVMESGHKLYTQDNGQVYI